MLWTQNLCRICGQISETCHLIYNKDVPSILERKIKKCLQLNLHKEDVKPKQICNCCVVKLNEFSNFKDICYATNQKFETIYYSSHNWPNKIYEYPAPKQSVIVTNKQVTDNLEFEFYRNGGVVLENINVANCQLNDAEMLGLVGNGDYNETNCDNYINNSNFSETKQRGHYTTVLKDPVNVELQTTNFNSHNMQKNIDDKICYIKYNNLYNPNSSISSIKLVSTKEVKTDNPKKAVIMVDSINKSINLPSKKNYKKEKIKKSFVCPHCNRKFVRRGTLNSHVAIHTNVRPYKCAECPKMFPVKSELTTHKKIHSDQHKCPFCFKKFTVPSKLGRHVRIHTNEKPYVCSFMNCNKAFSDKRNLEGHKLTHISEKKFSCSVCKKMFKTISRLKQHIKCHSCSEMYTCDFCSKKYKYKSNLISHIKKHNNICPYCKINCESNTLLIDHIRICKNHNS